MQVQKNNKRNLKSKKNQKRAVSAISNTEEDNDANNNENENNKSIIGANRPQLSSSCCSEDESNASQDQIGGEDSSKGKVALNLSGKTRASRGSATDPQSLYARVIIYDEKNNPNSHFCSLLNRMLMNLCFLIHIYVAEKKREDQREAEDFTEPGTKWNKS